MTHYGSPVSLTTTRATAEDWQRLRAVRLAALAESPRMFGSNFAREEAFSETEWRERAARPATFLASLDAADVGIAGVYEFDDGWCVMGMWVAPAARGAGVVEALVAVCVDEARSHGAVDLGLWVMEDNPRGIGAYSRLGFTVTETRQHVRDGRYEVAMVKKL
jgi:ribosomal protein S18 acetylase RimI-like enzyme